MELLFKQINTLGQLTHGNIRTFFRTRHPKKKWDRKEKKKMKTSLKNNQLPFLSILPFCLMAVSSVCFPLTGEAAEVELGSTDTNNSRASLNSEEGGGK